ncbi:FadR/GntR family transcriptional regulator [Leifsonia sp. Root112D2]|jgi:GntR family transcriptional repressor for pyruvate dehydrogenase complex|uniref:FadR/GntR family transcriptional regulator n=1 Tax=Leifsonia sp. Root112D2 TaxID=1736426 RepID=UPI0006FEA885|nr:FadR/GntR family transcriptional regulator [Leifsonia sp. Root112D2]KQV06931.1 GntR family transcriptional regulator [Leifsonia sp. Root112D2]
MAVTEEAISTIKAMIVAGELKPGDRLPPEKELSERLGVSRNSLREAVKSLEFIHVLDVRRGDGTFVTSLEPRQLLEAMSFVVDLHRDRSVLEIFEVRRVLEPHAAGVAARLISDSELDALAASLASVDESTDVDRMVAHDLEFHRIISNASGNAYLSSLLDSMSGSTTRARIWRGITQNESVGRTLSEHASILKALREHDVEMTRAALVVHIGGIESWLRAAVEA